MITTFYVSSDEIDMELLEAIKGAYPKKNIIIDVYQSEEELIEATEISNPEIISRINDIEEGKNLIIPKLVN